MSLNIKRFNLTEFKETRRFSKLIKGLRKFSKILRSCILFREELITFSQSDSRCATLITLPNGKEKKQYIKVC